MLFMKSVLLIYSRGGSPVLYYYLRLRTAIAWPQLRTPVAKSAKDIYLIFIFFSIL